MEWQRPQFSESCKSWWKLERSLPNLDRDLLLILASLRKQQGTYSDGDWLTNLWSCSNAAPVMMLPRKTLTNKNKWYFTADLLSRAESDVCPSILDIVMRISGRNTRNIFSAIPGRKPWTKDLMFFLNKREKNSTTQQRTMSQEKAEMSERKKCTYDSIIGVRKGKTFSMPSMLARDCTNAIGIMKKNVRKNIAAAISSLFTASSTYGIARLSQ